MESPPGEDPPFGGGSEANMKSKFDAYNSDEEIPSVDGFRDEEDDPWLPCTDSAVSRLSSTESLDSPCSCRSVVKPQKGSLFFPVLQLHHALVDLLYRDELRSEVAIGASCGIALCDFGRATTSEMARSRQPEVGAGRRSRQSKNRTTSGDDGADARSHAN